MRCDFWIRHHFTLPFLPVTEVSASNRAWCYQRRYQRRCRVWSPQTGAYRRIYSMLPNPGDSLIPSAWRTPPKQGAHYCTVVWKGWPVRARGTKPGKSSVTLLSSSIRCLGTRALCLAQWISSTCFLTSLIFKALGRISSCISSTSANQEGHKHVQNIGCKLLSCSLIYLSYQTKSVLDTHSGQNTLAWGESWAVGVFLFLMKTVPLAEFIFSLKLQMSPRNLNVLQHYLRMITF